MPGTWRYSTSPSNTLRSGVRIERCRVLAMVSPQYSSRGPRSYRTRSSRSRHRRHLLGVGDGLLDRSAQVERLFGQLVELTLDQSLEPLDGVLELHVLARPTGERLAHEEGLRKELLDPARSRHGHLVLLRELVHAEDGDDVLEIAVALEDL